VKLAVLVYRPVNASKEATFLEQAQMLLKVERRTCG